MNPGLPALARISLRMQRDERLTELAGRGSEAAFEAIVHRYRAPLVRHCAQVVGRDDADEAVQDALLRAHRALAAGTPVHSLGPWLHAIAHNAALSLLRGRRPVAEYREGHDTVRLAIESSREVPREQLEALVSALLELPVRQRRALVMRELEGRSYDEIAAHLGASQGAVRQLLNRARTSVRERLAALIPAELVLRWLGGGGGAAGSGALTLAGGGAFAAKLSSAVLLSAVPVVAVNPLPGKAPAPASASASAPASASASQSTHARKTTTTLRARSRPAGLSPLRPAAYVVVPATSTRPSGALPCHTVPQPSRRLVARAAASTGPSAPQAAGHPVTNATPPVERGSPGAAPALTATTAGAGSGQPEPPDRPAPRDVPRDG
jgi:RNA polymerase sigma factor (sigma-70 family)